MLRRGTKGLKRQLNTESHGKKLRKFNPNTSLLGIFFLWLIQVAHTQFLLPFGIYKLQFTVVTAVVVQKFTNSKQLYFLFF